MNTETSTPSAVNIPMVPYLVLPENENQQPYLLGSRCGSCGTSYLGKRAICINCENKGELEQMALSRQGEIFTFTVIHQSAPWVQVPYIAAIVKLPEGPVVSCTLTDIKPDPKSVHVGMPVEMVTEIVREDESGKNIIAYKFKPIAAVKTD